MGFRKKTNEVPKQEQAPAKEAPKSSGGKKTYHNNVLTVFKSSKDDGVFVSINPKADVEIKIDGKVVTGLISKDPIAELEKSVDEGRLTEEKAEAIAKKLQNVLANVTLVTE